MEGLPGADNILPLSLQELVRHHCKGHKACHVCLETSETDLQPPFTLDPKAYLPSRNEIFRRLLACSVTRRNHG